MAQQALLGGGSGIESDSKTNWEAHNVVNYAKLKEQYRVSELANDVVDSITQTGALPSNYITKSQARAMGWSEGKTLNNCVPGKALGGDVFANTNGVLPSANGRIWYDITDEPEKMTDNGGAYEKIRFKSTDVWSLFDRI